jgi:hypothetical protein
MKSESFRAAASIAIDEGSRERRATAQRLASQFETGADGFDLRSLERLGEEGLAAFLSSIGHQTPLPNRREPDPTAHVQSSAVAEPEGIMAGRVCEVDRAVVLLDPRFDRHAVHVAASRARDETRLVVDCSQINALLSSGLPLDRAQQAEQASVEDRRALLAERLSNAYAKTSTIAVIEQAALPAKQADRYHSRQSVDRAMQPPTKPPAAQESARPAARSMAREPDRELDHAR